MQITIDNVVNQFRALTASSVLSPETLRQIVAAVMSAVNAEREHDERVAEEGSMKNFQQRSGSRHA